MSLRQNICPSCKEKHYFRKDKGVCERCLDLITEALENRKAVERLRVTEDFVIVTLPTCAHYWPGFYEDLPRRVAHWHGYRERLRKALIRVYRTLGTQVAKDYVNRKDDALPWSGKWSGTYDGDRMMVSLRQYRAMKALRLLIDAVIAETFEAGILEGRDFIKSLANCTISPEEFGEEGIRLAQKMQKRKAQIDEELQESEEPE